MTHSKFKKDIWPYLDILWTDVHYSKLSNSQYNKLRTMLLSEDKEIYELATVIIKNMKDGKEQEVPETQEGE
jgi:succinate dehydrogenase flavin-adding protein (antitoxin of CptAB toxin-antitoxin module)